MPPAPPRTVTLDAYLISIHISKSLYKAQGYRRDGEQCSRLVADAHTCLDEAENALRWHTPKICLVANMIVKKLYGVAG